MRNWRWLYYAMATCWFNGVLLGFALEFLGAGFVATTISVMILLSLTLDTVGLHSVLIDLKMIYGSPWVIDFRR